MVGVGECLREKSRGEKCSGPVQAGLRLITLWKYADGVSKSRLCGAPRCPGEHWKQFITSSIARCRRRRRHRRYGKRLYSRRALADGHRRVVSPARPPSVRLTLTLMSATGTSPRRRETTSIPRVINSELTRGRCAPGPPFPRHLPVPLQHPATAASTPPSYVSNRVKYIK